MKLLFFIFLAIVFNSEGFTQTNIIYRDTLINQIDSNGKRNGLWIEFTNPKLIHISNIVSRGYYKENKKIGLWYYYHAYSDISGLKNTIDYKTNGDFEIDFGNKLFINKDSSKLTFYNPVNCCVECKKNKINKFECIEYKKNGIIYRKRTFSSFDDCINNLDTKW